MIHESPYLSRDGRKGLEEEIHQFTKQLEEGMMPLTHGEQTLTNLNKKAATDEILSLMIKIDHLNPSSPRLESLNVLSLRLQDDEISPDQARRDIQALMQD